MRDITVNKEERTITVDGHVAKATWTKEVIEDLPFAYHGVDILDEVAKALVHELDLQFTLTKEEKKAVFAQILEQF